MFTLISQKEEVRKAQDIPKYTVGLPRPPSCPGFRVCDLDHTPRDGFEYSTSTKTVNSYICFHEKKGSKFLCDGAAEYKFLLLNALANSMFDVKDWGSLFLDDSKYKRSDKNKMCVGYQLNTMNTSLLGEEIMVTHSDILINMRNGDVSVMQCGHMPCSNVAKWISAIVKGVYSGLILPDQINMINRNNDPTFLIQKHGWCSSLNNVNNEALFWSTPTVWPTTKFADVGKFVFWNPQHLVDLNFDGQQLDAEDIYLSRAMDMMDTSVSDSSSPPPPPPPPPSPSSSSSELIPNSLSNYSKTPSPVGSGLHSTPTKKTLPFQKLNFKKNLFSEQQHTSVEKSSEDEVEKGSEEGVNRYPYTQHPNILEIDENEHTNVSPLVPQATSSTGEYLQYGGKKLGNQHAKPQSRLPLTSRYINFSGDSKFFKIEKTIRSRKQVIKLLAERDGPFIVHQIVRHFYKYRIDTTILNAALLRSMELLKS